MNAFDHEHDGRDPSGRVFLVRVDKEVHGLHACIGRKIGIYTKNAEHLRPRLDSESGRWNAMQQRVTRVCCYDDEVSIKRIVPNWNFSE